MPLYEYICDNCDEQFEILRSISDQNEVICPKCEESARKLLSAFAIGGPSSKPKTSSCRTSAGGGGG
jgi:putative FmdB family regulatory protein